MTASTVIIALTFLAIACGCTSTHSVDSGTSGRKTPLGVILNRDTVFVEDFSQQTLLVTLVNRYNCKTCFDKIESFVLDSLRPDSNELGFIALARFGSKSLERRAASQFVESTMPRIATVVFDAQTDQRDSHPPREVEGGWHGRLDVRYTPEVLIFNTSNPDTPLHFRYNDLFVTGDDAGDSLGYLSWRGKQLLTEALRP